MRSIGRDLEANLFRLRPDGREVEVDRLRTEKAGAHGAWVSVSPGKLTFGPSRTSYFWSALSSFTGPACRQTCFDAVPDEGMIEQPLRAERVAIAQSVADRSNRLGRRQIAQAFRNSSHCVWAAQSVFG